MTYRKLLLSPVAIVCLLALPACGTASQLLATGAAKATQSPAPGNGDGRGATPGADTGLRRVFDALDADHDGYLTLSELQARPASGAAAAPPPFPVDLASGSVPPLAGGAGTASLRPLPAGMATGDLPVLPGGLAGRPAGTDAHGGPGVGALPPLDPAEVAKRFDAADTDHDGKLSFDEFKAVRPPAPTQGSGMPSGGAGAGMPPGGASAGMPSGLPTPAGMPTDGQAFGAALRTLSE